MFQETNGQPGSYLTSGDHFFIPWDIFIQQSEPGRAGATASATRYRGASLEPRACRAGASKGEGMAIAKVATSVRCATRPSRRTSACRPGIRRGRGRRCQHSRGRLWGLRLLRHGTAQACTTVRMTVGQTNKPISLAEEEGIRGDEKRLGSLTSCPKAGTVRPSALAVLRLITSSGPFEIIIDRTMG
jgi:hypothetical protein